MSLTLYGVQGNLRIHRIVIAASILNVPLKTHMLDYKDLKSKEYLAKHPLGKIPLLETPEGYLFESGAILRYIAHFGKGLYGRPDSFEKFEVDQWLEFANTDLDPANYTVLEHLFGWGEASAKSQDKYEAAKKQLKELLKVLDSSLKTRTYLVGDSLTIADICIAVQLHYQFQLVLDPKSREGLPNLLRWFNHIASIPQYVEVLGRRWLCQKEYPVIFANDKKEVVQTKETKSKPKEEKPKPAAQKKQVTKKETAQEEEEEQPQKDRKPNPFLSLPPTTFDLEAFKRQISNAESKEAVLQNFWQKYDSNGWSLWKVEYQKYEGEGKVGYLTANLKNGFERNLDSIRKFAFAGTGVYGTAPNFQIRGVWMLRGHEIPADWKEQPSFQYHTFRRLDHTNEADRKLLEEYWINISEGSFVEGLPVFEARHFK